MASKALDLPRYSALNKPSTVIPPLVVVVLVFCRRTLRHRNQFQFPGEYDAEASAAAAPDSPEEILPHGFPVQDSPVNIHDSGVNHVVRRQPIFSQQHPVPAAADVATRLGVPGPVNLEFWADIFRMGKNDGLLGV
nr:Os06g0549950 [Ipomoea batatas]